MAEDDDILGGDGETSEGGENVPAEDLVTPGVEGACLSCSAPTVGVFCANCGQKNDNLRRSLFLLARDFVEDTFAFDSRMWRTLGLLAVAPGVVPKNYAHGRRSKYTPPVRLFLVVSFLFFLLLNFTQTLFAAVEIKESKTAEVEETVKEALEGMPIDEADFDLNTDLEIGDDAIDCDMNIQLRFFIRASDIETDPERWKDCVVQIEAAVNKDIDQSLLEPSENGDALTEKEASAARGILNKIAVGANKAVEDPKAFNAAFNNWLPRVMFLMTPILALIMGIFIRGRDALFFDHMVVSIYSHAVGFAVVGLAVLAAQASLPFAGLAAALGLSAYIILTVKRAYNRGWIKTIYSSAMAGLIYLLILMIVVMLIVTRIVLAG